MSEGTGKPVVIPDPPPAYSTLEKTQYYLDKMDFEIGSIDNSFGVKTSYALLIVESYLDSNNVKGIANDELLERIKMLANSGITYSDIKSEYIDSWSPGNSPVERLDSNNGKLDVSKMTQIPKKTSGTVPADKELAIAWAMMVHEAIAHNERVEENSLLEGEFEEVLNISKFSVKDTSGSYRTYHKQAEAEIIDEVFWTDGNYAAGPKSIVDGSKTTWLNDAKIWLDAEQEDNPGHTNRERIVSETDWSNIPDEITSEDGALYGYGTSNHGWGLAIDIQTGGRGEHKPTSTECIWLTGVSSDFGFAPYTDGINSDGTPYVVETWHWNYIY